MLVEGASGLLAKDTTALANLGKLPEKATNRSQEGGFRRADGGETAYYDQAAPKRRRTPTPGFVGPLPPFADNMFASELHPANTEGQKINTIPFSQDGQAEDSYDVNLAVGDAIEIAESIARIKQAEGRKPQGEALTVINASLLDLQANTPVEQVPTDSERTAEMVLYTGSPTDSPQTTVKEIGVWLQRVDGDGGILLARFPSSAEDAFRKQYTTDRGKWDIETAGITSTVIFRMPQQIAV